MINFASLLMVISFGQKQVLSIIAIVIVALVVLFFVGIFIKNMIKSKKDNESLPSLIELGLEDDPDAIEEEEEFTTAFNLNDTDDDLDDDNEADVVLREARVAERKSKRRGKFFRKSK